MAIVFTYHNCTDYLAHSEMQDIRECVDVLQETLPSSVAFEIDHVAAHRSMFRRTLVIMGRELSDAGAEPTLFECVIRDQEMTVFSSAGGVLMTTATAKSVSTQIPSGYSD
jgi:hypothetical protein